MFEVKVRKALLSDLDAVVTLEDECEGADAWSLALLSEGLAGTIPTVQYLVAEGTGILGYAVVSCVDEIAEIQRIGVTQGHQRSGVGSQLLAEAFRLARAEGTQRMLLEVRADNDPAIALYAARGFIEIDRRPRYYRDGSTAIVMRIPVAKGCNW
jgi:ribosomal-protein-alanine N-acetyltransferase